MNTLLQQLLAECGFRSAGDIWDRAILIRNYGCVPEPIGIPADSAKRGFRLVLLGAEGKATHFARCDAAANAQFERECSVLASLQRVESLTGSIPRVQTAAAGDLRVQVMPFVRNRPYSDLISPFSPDRWLSDTGTILALARRVGVEVDRALSQRTPSAQSVSIQHEVARDLDRLEAFGIPHAALEAIRHALSGVRPLPRELQHGDLWPDNVLRHAGGWQLIDFAEFGDVSVPLYDLWHMIRYRPRGRIARLRPFADRWDAVTRRLITSEMARLQLSPAEIGATRLFYLVHMAAYRTRHGVAFQFAEEYTSAVAAAGEQFARGTTLAGFSAL